MNSTWRLRCQPPRYWILSSSSFPVHWKPSHRPTVGDALFPIAQVMMVAAHVQWRCRLNSPQKVSHGEGWRWSSVRLAWMTCLWSGIQGSGSQDRPGNFVSAIIVAWMKGRKKKKRKTINHAMPYEVDLPPGIFLWDEICEDSSAVFDRGSSRYSSN